MTAIAVAPKTLDLILAFQFTVAWAGEALCEPPRLRWWRTDLVDEFGGGDFMQRLAPRTHKWASLEAVREAARQADQRARKRTADSDRARTLYFWGFETDEALTERLRDLKWSQQEPAHALSLPLPLSAEFNREQFEAALKTVAIETPYTVQSSGREIKATFPDDLEQAARMLLGAMQPLPDDYPAPFFRV